MSTTYKMIVGVLFAFLALATEGSAQHIISDIEETFTGIEEVVVHGESLEVSHGY